MFPLSLLAEGSFGVAVVGGPDSLFVGVVEGYTDWVGGDSGVETVEASAVLVVGFFDYFCFCFVCLESTRPRG